MPEIKRLILPDQLPPISHYCHVVRAANHIWLSGATGASADGTVPEDVVDQFRVAIASIDAALRAAGGEPRHIVKVVVYLTDVADRARINPVRQEYFGEHRPASTLIGVAALAIPALKVEIDAEAFVAD